MLGFSVQFGGVENARLLALLGEAIALAVVAYGLYELLIRRQVRRGGVAVLVGLAAGGLVAAAAVRVPMDSQLQRGLWLALLASVIVLAVGVFYSAVYAYLGRARMTALLGMRVLAILALLAILFKPALSLRPASQAFKLALAVLVDRSGSMGTIDHPDLPSRYRQAAEALAAQADRMDRRFRVGWYHFADEAQAVAGCEELPDLAPAEPEAGTDLAGAIRRACAGYAADELAGVLVISDGVQNAPGDVLEAAAESTVPIYVIGVGSETQAASGPRNVRVLAADAPMTAVQDNVSTVTATLRLTAWANISTRVALLEDGREVASKQVLADGSAQDIEVKLDWTPSKRPEQAASGPAPAADVRKLRVLVEPSPAEADQDDNAAELHVLVTRPGVRVLYVEGTMRPEYKFLRRILSTDPNVKFMSLVRFQDGRFLCQGSIDGDRLTGLPATDEEFQLFDVLILGDLDRTFLTSEQMERIRRSVYEGKALLMLGGRNSFGPGGYGGTPIESALPVFCGPRSAEQETMRFVPQLTAAGARSPVFAGLERYFHGPAGPAEEPLPELLGCVAVPSAKPHADVLAIHPARANLVVLAVHQYGKGRAAAFTADTTWQWFLRLRPMGADSPYHRFWGQLIRYLAGAEQADGEAQPAVVARLSKPYAAQNQPLRIMAQVRGAESRPAEGAGVSATVSTADGQHVATLALAAGTGGGLAAPKPDLSGLTALYEATFTPDRPGKYVVAVTAVDARGQTMGRDELPLTVAPSAKETDRVARDAETLKAIARARDGVYAELSHLPEVIDEIHRRTQSRLLPAPPPREIRLYDFALLFAAFVVLVTAEWLIRRNWQLQ